MQKVQKAKNFAKSLHTKDSRLSGENVYDHTLRVHNKLKDSGVTDDNILIAALLHQALTYSTEVEKEILKEFGEDVTNIVRGYNALSEKKVAHEGTQGINEKYIIQTYLNLAKDLRVLLIRLADKADNIETAFALTRKHRKQVAERAFYVYAPITRLLGLSSLTKDLENGAFKVLYPKEYFLIETAITDRKPTIEKFFRENIPVVKDLLKEEGIKADISYRIKHIYGIYRKAKHLAGKGLKKIGKDYSGVYDIAAMRVIVDTEENCYKTEALLCELWDSIVEVRDDYIKNPKPSGYKSIHNHHIADDSLQIEVQIRTKEMHEINEYGPASHVYYKVGESLKKNLGRSDDILKELSQWKEEQLNNEGDTSLDQFTDNVYAFTPKGDIIELPKGSSVIDFAYGVHTGIGNSCVGAVVNGEIVKLDYQIRNGDQVIIKTLSSKKLPSRDWLKFAKSARTKAHIRKALRIFD